MPSAAAILVAAGITGAILFGGKVAHGVKKGAHAVVCVATLGHRCPKAAPPAPAVDEKP